MLTVIAKFKAKLDRLEEAKKILCSLVVPTLMEEGCIQYDLHQSKEEPDTFFIYENWTNDECLTRYLSKDYNRDFYEKSKMLLQQPMEIFLLSRI